MSYTIKGEKYVLLERTFFICFREIESNPISPSQFLLTPIDAHTNTLSVAGGQYRAWTSTICSARSSAREDSFNFTNHLDHLFHIHNKSFLTFGMYCICSIWSSVNPLSVLKSAFAQYLFSQNTFIGHFIAFRFKIISNFSCCDFVLKSFMRQEQSKFLWKLHKTICTYIVPLNWMWQFTYEWIYERFTQNFFLLVLHK